MCICTCASAPVPVQLPAPVRATPIRVSSSFWRIPDTAGQTARLAASQRAPRSSPNDSKTTSSLFFEDGPDDAPLRDRDEWSAREEGAKTTERHLNEKVEAARQNGMSDSGAHELAALLAELIHIFRTKLGSDPPADLQPMKIHLLPGAKPFRARIRRYPPPQAALIRRKADELLRLGLVRRNNTSQVVVRPIAGPEGWAGRVPAYNSFTAREWQNRTFIIASAAHRQSSGAIGRCQMFCQY